MQSDDVQGNNQTNLHGMTSRISKFSLPLRGMYGWIGLMVDKVGGPMLIWGREGLVIIMVTITITTTTMWMIMMTMMMMMIGSESANQNSYLFLCISVLLKLHFLAHFLSVFRCLSFLSESGSKLNVFYSSLMLIC